MWRVGVAARLETRSTAQLAAQLAPELAAWQAPAFVCLVSRSVCGFVGSIVWQLGWRLGFAAQLAALFCCSDLVARLTKKGIAWKFVFILVITD